MLPLLDQRERIGEAKHVGGITEERDRIPSMPGHQRAEGTPIDFWQVKQFVRANFPQEAGWMIARVAQRDTQPAIIHPAWLAF